MSLVLLLVAVLSVGWLTWTLWGKVSPAKSLAGIPLVEFDGDNSRDRYTREAGSLLGKGYDEHIRNGQPFCIRDFLNPSRPRVFLPSKYVEELRNAPQEKLSLPGILNKTSTMSKVGGPEITEEIQTSARVDLNRALNNLIEPMQSLCFRAAEKEMPKCPDWTSVVLYPKMLELFSHMSARVMVGPELCEAWPAISMKYITRVLAAQGAIRKKYYPALYWTAYYINPEVALAEKHDDFIQWIMDNYRANGKTVTPDETVQNIFIVMFASMHGTSFIALQSLLSLLGTPNALNEVREEIERVSQNELKGSPVWTRHALGELKLMDSFMKETLRIRPTVQRYAMTPYTFKDGLQVPAGTVISFPNLRYNTDSSTMSEASTFDGKRWLHRRFTPGMSKFQFASTAEDAFDWGAGPHACPGRFMAELSEGGPERPAESKRFLDLAPDTSIAVMLRDMQG
ncbi:cytochrome P450 [Xylaria palmicola]|nr:cytochrome P450 [Xylaria palmicola]